MMDGNQRWRERNGWIGARITTAEGQSFKKQLEFTRTFRVQCAIWKKKTKKGTGSLQSTSRTVQPSIVVLSREWLLPRKAKEMFLFSPRVFVKISLFFRPWWFSVCSPLSSWVIMHETLEAQISSTSLIKVSVGFPLLPLSLITVIVFWSGLKWANFNPLIHSLFCECS